MASGIRVSLSKMEIGVRPPDGGLKGGKVTNICNRGRSGRGVQLEVSRALRVALAENEARRGRFTGVIRGLLG